MFGEQICLQLVLLQYHVRNICSLMPSPKDVLLSCCFADKLWLASSWWLISPPLMMARAWRVTARCTYGCLDKPYISQLESSFQAVIICRRRFFNDGPTGNPSLNFTWEGIVVSGIASCSQIDIHISKPFLLRLPICFERLLQSVKGVDTIIFVLHSAGANKWHGAQ